MAVENGEINTTSIILNGFAATGMGIECGIPLTPLYHHYYCGWTCLSVCLFVCWLAGFAGIQLLFILSVSRYCHVSVFILSTLCICSSSTIRMIISSSFLLLTQWMCVWQRCLIGTSQSFSQWNTIVRIKSDCVLSEHIAHTYTCGCRSSHCETLYMILHKWDY